MATAALSACSSSAPRSAPPVPSTPLPTAAPAATIPPPTGSQLILDDARRFVFRVRNADCLATGTAFTFGSRIITNRHVAAGATVLQMATWSGQDFQAAVLGHSADDDLASLAASSSPVTGAGVSAGSEPAPGQTVYVAGYPEGDALTVTSGSVVQRLDGDQFGLAGSVVEMTDRIKPGNSGSPLLDSRGRVVGVVFGIDLQTNEGLAMPLGSLQRFVSASPSHVALPCTGS